MSNTQYSKLKSTINEYVNRYPLPPKEINHQRFEKLQELKKELPDNQNEYNRLRTQLILSNGGFGMKYAIKYCKMINDESVIEDIFQQSQIGIIEAVDLFDPSRKVNFTTFAYWHIMKCIIEYIKDNKTVKVPKAMAKNIKNVKEVHSLLYSENYGAEPTDSEIKDRLYDNKQITIKEKTVNEILQLIGNNSADSTDNFIIGVTDISDSNSDITNNDCLLLLKKMIFTDLSELDDLFLLDIIKMRFGIDYDRPYSISEIKLLKNMDNNHIEICKNKTRVYLSNFIKN